MPVETYFVPAPALSKIGVCSCPHTPGVTLDMLIEIDATLARTIRLASMCTAAERPLPPRTFRRIPTLFPLLEPLD